MTQLQILQAIAARLQSITVANGYATNAGAHVNLGDEWPDEADLPALTLHEGHLAPNGYGLVRAQGRAGADAMKMRGEYTVEGIADCTGTDTYTAAHALIADIKRALFAGSGLSFGDQAGDHKLEGHGVIPRQRGSNRVSVAVLGSYFYIDHFIPQ